MTETAALYDKVLKDAEENHRLARYSDAELLYRKARTAAESAIGIDSPVVQVTLERLVRLYLTIAEVDKAAALLKQLRQSKERTHGQHHPETARIIRKQGDVHMLEGRHRDAENSYSHAIDIWLDHLGPLPAGNEDLTDFNALYGVKARFGSPEWIQQCVSSNRAAEGNPRFIAEHLAEIAMALRTRGAKSLPLTLFQFACRTLQNLPPEVIWVQSKTITETGALLIECERYGEAEAFLKGYLDYFDRCWGNSHDMVAPMVRIVAVACHKQDRLSDADKFFKRALTLQEQTLDRSHPALAITLCDLAALYLAERQYDKAESLLQRALSIREGSLGYDHLEVANTLCSLGDVALHENKLMEAEKCFQRAVRIYEQVYGAYSEHVAPILDKIATGYMTQCKYHKAEAILARSLELKRMNLPEDHLDTAKVLQQLARVFSFWGKPIDAEGYYKRAIEIVEKPGDPQLLSILSCLNKELAAVYRDQCRYIEAEKLLKRTIESLEDYPRAQPEDLPPLLNTLAELYLQTRKLREADKRCQQIADICEGKHAAIFRNELARSLVNKAEALALRGDSISAEASLISSLRAAVFHSKQALLCRAALVRFCLNRGRLSDAQELIDQAIPDCIQSFGAETPEHGDLLELAAEIRMAESDEDGSMALIKRIINIREQWQGDAHPSYATAQVLLGRLYGWTHSAQHAEEAFHKALGNMERSLGQHHTRLASTLVLLAQVFCHRNRMGDANALLNRATRIWDRVLAQPDLALFQALCTLLGGPWIDARNYPRIQEVLLSIMEPCVGLFGRQAVFAVCTLLCKLVENSQFEQCEQVIDALMNALDKCVDNTVMESKVPLQKLFAIITSHQPQLIERVPERIRRAI